MRFNEDGIGIPEKDPIDPIAIEMLQYASQTLKNVDESFFEGLHTLAYKLGNYIVNRKLFNGKDELPLKESIEFWELKEFPKEKDTGRERIITDKPWEDKLLLAELDSESEYLPYGVSKIDKDNKLIWSRGWVSTEYNKQQISRDFQIEKLPQMVEEFYSTISKMYGEMAHNELKDAKLTVPIEWYKNKDDEVFNIIKQGKFSFWFSEKDSSSMNIPIAGNYTTATIMVHELMHRFITINDGITIYSPDELKQSAKYQNSEKTQDFINDLILQETCTIYAEQLFADYLEQKYPDANTTDFLFKYRLGDFARLSKVDLSYIDDLKKLLRFSKLYEKDGKLTDKEKQEVTSFARSTPEFRETREFPERYTSEMLHRFSHIFGYMYASYLHERTLKGELNPQDVLEKCTKAYIYSHSDEDKQMKILTDLGAPFIKNGQFVIDDDVISIFDKATTSEIERRVEKNKSRKHSKVLSLKKIKEAISKIKSKTKTEKEL